MYWFKILAGLTCSAHYIIYCTLYINCCYFLSCLIFSAIYRTHVDLFGGQPLGIFKKGDEDTHEPAAPVSVLPTWERLYLHELEQSMQHPPNNAFVEMIQWTNQGKLWTFPIDNEAGIVISTLTLSLLQVCFVVPAYQGRECPCMYCCVFWLWYVLP